MQFEAVNVLEDVGSLKWVSAGKPTVPAIEIDEHIMPILHTSQLASLLGLASEKVPANPALAFDTVNVLTSWLDILHQMDWGLMSRPTPSRSRSTKNLTVNTFHPFELLPQAWSEGRFPWHPEDDAMREATLGSAVAVRTYAQSRLDTWEGFLLQVDDEFAVQDRPVTSPRGNVTFGVVLSSQRSHCAYHHRQLLYFLNQLGVDVSNFLNVEVIPGLDLPEAIF